GRKYSFDPADQRALGMWDFIEDEKETSAVGLGIQIFMGLVGAFTLLIAGVGVANIMYVVVKERTQEIGIKRALGARRRHIMAQFLFEAMAIALSGGLVGLAVATLIVLGVDAIPTEGNEAMQYILNPKLSWPIALICVGILIGVGLLAGLLPARRAAAVDPVDRDRFFTGPGPAVPTSIEARVEFQRDAAGKITSLTWKREGTPPRIARRVEIETLEAVRFANGAVELAGTLIRPNVAGKHPA